MWSEAYDLVTFTFFTENSYRLRCINEMFAVSVCLVQR
ncbi:hypothetical protein Rleg10DRAFT_0100 [Rhizobium leguminosarum bv. trifolii WSM2012]|nr:hypothetical protein Rleg10DRAFT_0100 [Rhizobium leguminosarum bv. trifolii WSM2012]